MPFADSRFPRASASASSSTGRGASKSTVARPTTGRAGTGRPGTAMTSRAATARPRTAASTIGGVQQVICAVTESRGVSATVGLCFVNLTTAECVLSEICDSQTYVRTIHKLSVFDPAEIVVPSTAIVPQKSTLVSIIEHYMVGVKVTQVARKYYNESLGHDYVQQLAFAEDLAGIKVAISAKFYAVSAAAAALKHIELTYVKFALNTLRIRYQGSEGSMLIDFSTVHSLELIQNFTNPKSTDSLFGLLNNTDTAMGARLLRLNVLQPSTDVSTLEGRLDALEEVTQREQMFFQIRDALKGFPDMDRLLTALTTIPVKASLKHSEQSINNIIILKQAMSAITPIYEALAPARSKMLVTVRNLCSPDRVQPVLDLINEAINEDVAFSKSPLDLRNQRCYAVKSGVNGLLDVARQTYKEATEDVYALVEELSAEHELPLELKYESSRGYYLRLPPSELDENPLAPVFVNVVRRKKVVEFTTLELVKRNAKISDSLTEVLLMSDKTVQQLVDDVRKEVAALFKVSESIAMLDMIASFAHLCTIQDYTRPEFTDTLAIKSGRHPVREKIHRERFVPNDAYASQQSRFQIVTGCNMSGKSTYIRSIALLAIMAQTGSFVPAHYASFPITTQLFARVSMDDAIEANVSTFAAEMRETAFILRNTAKGALVIVDELGRGTSTRDGIAIALAICEALVESRALVWFATHFGALADILAARAGVATLHMQVHMDGAHDAMTMLYKIADGRVRDEHYGLALARLVALPPRVLQRAAAVSQALVQRAAEARGRSSAVVLARRRALVLRLKETLCQARDGQMDDRALRRFLRRVQEDFVAKMAALAGDAQEEDADAEGGEDADEMDGEEDADGDGDGAGAGTNMDAEDVEDEDGMDAQTLPPPGASEEPDDEGEAALAFL